MSDIRDYDKVHEQAKVLFSKLDAVYQIFVKKGLIKEEEPKNKEVQRRRLKNE